jgi:hypothetical protein
MRAATISPVSTLGFWTSTAPVGEFGNGFEFGDEAEIGVVVDLALAGGGGMENVGVVRGDRLRPCTALEGGNLLPELVQHRVRRRVTIMRAPVHLAAGDDVDACYLLIEDGALTGPVLRGESRPVGKPARCAPAGAVRT